MLSGTCKITGTMFCWKFSTIKTNSHQRKKECGKRERTKNKKNKKNINSENKRKRERKLTKKVRDKGGRSMRLKARQSPADLIGQLLGPAVGVF